MEICNTIKDNKIIINDQNGNDYKTLAVEQLAQIVKNDYFHNDDKTVLYYNHEEKFYTDNNMYIDYCLAKDLIYISAARLCPTDDYTVEIKKDAEYMYNELKNSSGKFYVGDMLTTTIIDDDGILTVYDENNHIINNNVFSLDNIIKFTQEKYFNNNEKMAEYYLLEFRFFELYNIPLNFDLAADIFRATGKLLSGDKDGYDKIINRYNGQILSAYDDDNFIPDYML